MEMESEKLILSDEFQNKSKFKMIILLSIVCVLLILSVVFIILYIKEKNDTSGEKNQGNKEKDNYIPLSSWYDCDAKTKLIQFIEKINNQEHYVPKEDRIAVFDLDGTLFQETDPTYDDWKLYYWRVYNDSNFEATNEQKLIADAIYNVSKDNEMPDDLNIKIAETYTQLFYNMTVEEYQKYILDFVNKPADGYENLKRGDAFYKPMLELIEYIQKNDFNVYITSGTDRYQVRAVIKGHINIPDSNVIGSEYNIIAKNQGNEDGFKYTYQNNDDFRFDGEFLRKNLKTNKIIGIIREIGKQPLLAFGNSGGDSDMANYVLNKNKYDSLAFMVCCDDTERERGNLKKANEMKEKCKNNGWIPISMKENWKTIYGENVRKK